jgi:site-specific DNA-methyltransferase (adenine-specific)
MFYSIYDLLLYTARKRGEDESTLTRIFRDNKVKKSTLMELKNTRDLCAYKELLPIVLEYLKMNELELDLALGKVPNKYQEAFLHNIHSISLKLERSVKKEIVQACDIEPFFSTALGTLYNADCINVMTQMASDSVDLIFADPPFNLRKEYGNEIEDDLSKTDYINWCHSWLDECIRILKPGGSIYIYNLPKWCTYIAEYLNSYLTFRHWIAVDMKFSLPLNGRLSPAHYGLLCYIKGSKPNVFNNQRMPMQVCRHCGGEIKDYGGYKAKMNPAGVNVSDVWTDIYPVRHKSRKNREYNELSVKFLDRVISMSSNEGDFVFDPFGGSGTTYIVAELLGRKWAGSEVGNCQVIKDRFTHITNDGTLLKYARTEKSALFSEKIKKLRKENGFWICEDF